MFNAFEYAMGIYGLSTVVTLMVWVVIVAIRWLSAERVPVAPLPVKKQAR
jgi:hypothetical protein